MGMAGGIILFLIAIRMIFPSKNGIFGEAPEEEPFIVPLAVPLIAGPSAMATVMLLATREPEHIFGAWLIALTCAWLLSFLILSQAATLSKWLGERFLGGLSRLMGMLLTAIAVQSFLEGLRLFLAELG
jgi:small neutral amino acid transporter SnatA (MarC family)